MYYCNGVWKNYVLVLLHLGKLWVSILTTFVKPSGYYCNGVWKNCGLV